MSISSEITRINGNIASAYTEVSSKGGTLPAEQNSANLPAAIESIPSTLIPLTASLLKGDGAGGVSAAVAGTDYVEPDTSDVVRYRIPASEIPGVSGGNIDLTRKGRVCVVSINLNFDTAPSYGTAFANVPYGFRPAYYSVFGLPFMDGKMYYSEIQPSGNIVSYTTYQTGSYSFGNIVYLTNDEEA